MSSNVVKLKPETYARVKQIAEESHRPMQEIVAAGIEALDRLQFAREFTEDYAALRRDSQAWRKELQERELWEVTLSDGLDD
jgi:hypothetical protein